MAYQASHWKDTHKNRTDLTGLLTHLTRRQEENDLNAVHVLIKILNDQTLIGSKKGYIVGGREVVCFQEVPLYSVAENAINHVEDYEANKVSRLRYDACGIAIHKSIISQLFTTSQQLIPEAGVRPVIYERTEFAKQFISPDQHWRIVDLDIRNLYLGGSITDWTHEREWRLLGSLTLRYDILTVLLRDTAQYKEFMNKINPDIVKQLAGIVILETLLY